MSFRGGYIFNKFDGTGEPVLREMPVPEKIYIPLSGNLAETYVSTINEGKTVRAGDIINESSSGIKKCIVSPVNGTVLKSDKDGIVIKSDGTSSFEPVKGHPREPWHLERQEVFNLFCTTGCTFLTAMTSTSETSRSRSGSGSGSGTGNAKA